jgi:hypothetical protein
MNPNLKKALIVFGGGILLFYVFKKLKPIGGSSKKNAKSSSSLKPKEFTDEQKKNAAIVIKAYSDAMKSGENKAFLDEMNAEFAKTYRLRVLKNKADGNYFAADLDGNKVN